MYQFDDGAIEEIKVKQCKSEELVIGHSEESDEDYHYTQYNGDSYDLSEEVSPEITPDSSIYTSSYHEYSEKGLLEKDDSHNKKGIGSNPLGICDWYTNTWSGSTCEFRKKGIDIVLPKDVRVVIDMVEYLCNPPESTPDSEEVPLESTPDSYTSSHYEYEDSHTHYEYSGIDQTILHTFLFVIYNQIGEGAGDIEGVKYLCSPK